MPEHFSVIPDAFSIIKGISDYPKLYGEVRFYGVHGGTVVTAMIKGLPDNHSGNFYGFHIHEGGSCTGDKNDPLKNTGNHYNSTKIDRPAKLLPDNLASQALHPNHTGDMPVLMGNKGMAWCEFYTDRFFPEDVIGRTVVIHDMPDDFRSQPSGDSGSKIACGVIKSMEDQ